jgi:hypothetical protein
VKVVVRENSSCRTPKPQRKLGVVRLTGRRALLGNDQKVRTQRADLTTRVGLLSRHKATTSSQEFRDLRTPLRR